MKKVVLRFAEYNANSECYSVTAELWQCNKRTGDQYQMKLSGKLPSVENVLICYREWQEFYATILQILRHSSCKDSTEIDPNTETTPKTNNLSWFILRENIEIEEGGIRNVCIEEFEEICDRLKEMINNWLNDSVFSDVIGQLYARLLPDEEILVAIETDDEKLWRLPWHLWNFFDTFHRAEVILSNLKYIRLETQKQHFNPLVNVLVILGDSAGIDLSQDRKLWLRLFWHWAYLQFLEQPQTRQKITNQLASQRGFDILFFAGHSQSKINTTTGTFYINERESNNSVNINQLEKSFRTAVRNGLQLAIFNSCDGIGLARRLLEFNMPRIVVMRENVPNKVAQEFLKYFLQEFSRGKSLPVALRKAREQLEGIEDEFPCASWLPVLCKNSATPPLTWKMMKGKIPSFLRISAIAPMILGFLIAIVFNWVFFPSEPAMIDAALASNRISLGEEILIKNKSSSEKKDGVSAFEDENYGVAMSKFADSLKNNPNDPEVRVYLNNAKVALFGVNPIKIAVSLPIGSNQELAEEILRGIALAQEEINKNSRINDIKDNLQVIIADDENDGKLAQKIANFFVKDSSILAVVGHIASTASQAAMPIYQSGQLVAITPTSFSDDIKGNAYIFRMVPHTNSFAAKLSDYVRRKINNPNVAICFDPDAPDNQYFRQKFEQILPASGGKIIPPISCPFKNSNFNSNIVVNTIKNNNANSLLVTTHVDRISQAIEVFKTVRDNRLQIDLFGSPTFYSNQTLKLGKEAVEGLIISVPYYASKDNEFSRKLEQHWGVTTDTWRVPMAYDATQAIVIGLEKVLQQKQQPIRQQLDKVLRQPNFSYPGVTGTIKFDLDTGVRDFSTLNQDAIIQIQNGDFVKIE
jgi:branched-chain amino acid transport system substrate-binding protein